MLLIVLQNNPEQRDSLSEMNSKVVSTRELLEIRIQDLPCKASES
jgi:hypothetical protein